MAVLEIMKSAAFSGMAQMRGTGAEMGVKEFKCGEMLTNGESG